jgi:hypothetical protein
MAAPVPRATFGDTGTKNERAKPKSPGKDNMNFVPLPAGFSRFKVWSSRGLPRQVGGAETVIVDQSTTALGRGVQFRSSPTGANFPGIASSESISRAQPRTATRSAQRQAARTQSSRDELGASPERQAPE